MVKSIIEVICVLKLYHCDISKLSDEDFVKLYTESDSERQKKADKLKSDPAKKLSIAAGELAKKAIAEELNIDPKSIRFRTTKAGKPYAENLNIEFSISHSGNIAVCAISDKPVGIDIERIKEASINVAKRLYTPDEQKYVFEKWDLSKQRFYEVWTRKEAYVKKIGRGITHFPQFCTMHDKSIVTHIRDRYIVSVAK